MFQQSERGVGMLHQRDGHGHRGASAALFLFGAAVIFLSWSYEIGELRRMGPGYFPMLLGVTLCVFAILIAVQDAKKRKARNESPVETMQPLAVLRVRWRPLFMPLLAILLFASLLESAGLVPAVVASVTAAGFAERSNSPFVIAVIAAVTAVFTSVVFVHLLGIPLRLFAV